MAMVSPWVSRTTYASLQVLYAAQADLVRELRAEIQAERDRYTALVDKTIALQRQGFVAPAPIPDAPTNHRLPAKVQAAIAAHMSPNGPAGRATADQARLWLASEVPLDTVVQRIEQGAGE